MSKYFVQKQLIPADQNFGDPTWAKRQIWVLKLNSDDDINSFDTIEEANAKRDELDSADPSKRVYRVVEKVDNKYIAI
jgi:hypothetical protein